MIISASGKIGSGKDTVGKIIQIITDNPHFTNEAVEDWLDREILNPKFQNKKWADALKDIVCRLINCTREQLEDREFKEKELPEEWTKYSYADGFSHIYTYKNGEETKTTVMNSVPCDKERYEQELRVNWQTAYKTVYTPRLLLQHIGTDLFRDKLLANIWVNSLMSEYKPISLGDSIVNVGQSFTANIIYPNWIITDTRFPNELKAVKDKGGISIKVIRPKEALYMYNGDKYNLKDLFTEVHKDTGEYPLKVYADDNWLIKESEHESETALDNAEFDETIINDGSILDLIVKVREVLIKRSIINN